MQHEISRMKLRMKFRIEQQIECGGTKKYESRVDNFRKYIKY